MQQVMKIKKGLGIKRGVHQEIQSMQQAMRQKMQ